MMRLPALRSRATHVATPTGVAVLCATLALAAPLRAQPGAPAPVYATAAPSTPAPSAPDSIAPAAPAPARTVAPLVTDRPGVSAMPTLVGVGAVQLEAGYHVDRAGARRLHSIGETLLRVGMHRRVELRVALNSYLVAHGGSEAMATGFADAALGAKVGLTDGGAGMSLHPRTALVLNASLPTGGHAVAHHRSEPSALVAATWNTPHGTSLTVNAGAMRRDVGDGARLTSYASSAWFSIPVTAHVGSYVEYATSWSSRHGSATRYADVGVVLLPGALVQLDAWVGVPVQRTVHDASVGVGLVRRF